MTSYVLKIDGTARNFTSLKTDKIDDRKNPHTWTATLSDPAEAVTKGNAVDIERDGTNIFQGIMEWTDPDLGPPGTLKVGGRHTLVLLWRKWIERYADVGGFWTNYYPNKIVQFLLHPSRSDWPDTDHRYRRVGWGLDPRDGWVITASDSADADHDPSNAGDRLNTIPWQLGKNQANNEYIQVDLGSSTTICGIRIENKTRHPQDFVRNYKIETSTTGAFTGEEVQVATKTNNRAINIVEAWTAAATQFVRITCTAAAAFDWRVGNIFIYESSGEISGISEGTLTEHLPLNCTLMAEDAASGQKEITVKEAWRFRELGGTRGDDIIVGDDDNEETAKISSIDVDNNILTVQSNLTNAYTTADNGYVLNLDTFTEINLLYKRRTAAIDEIVKMCMTDEVLWEWEVTDAGVVNMGLRVGSDKAVTFVFATNLLEASNKDDDREKVDVVLVLGKGKGSEQDMISSGWQGTGDYEKVVGDSKLATSEACRAKAEAILAELGSGRQEVVVKVDDTYASGTWGLSDGVTLTDATVTGLSGVHRVKRVIRFYNADGETVVIHCQFKTPSSIDAIQKLQDQMYDNDQEGDYPAQIFDEVTTELGFDLFYEAELMSLDSDVTTVDDGTVSNEQYIRMASTEDGIIWWGPGAALKPGEYEVMLMCKVGDNSSSDTLVTIDVYSATKGATFTTFPLAPDDFSASDTWQAVKFTVVIDAVYTDVEFRANTFQSGISSFSCDWIGVSYISFIDYPPGPPDVPANVTATARPASVRLGWDPNTEADFDHYEIYKHTANSPGAATKIAEAYTNFFVYLADASEYEVTLYFWIKAVDWTEHKSDYSTVVSAAPALIGGVDLEIEMRPWTSNLGFVWDEDGSDWDEIWWGLGGNEKNADAEVTFADGSSTGINKGTYGALDDNTYWVYWDEDQKSGGKYDLQFTTTYSNAVGEGKGLIAVVQINEALAESPTMILFNSYTPTIGAGIIGAYAIWSKHITADWITGKKFRTTGRVAGPPAIQGIEMSDAGIIAYSDATQKTFELEAATGYISVYGVGMFSVKKADGTIIGYLDGTTVAGPVDTIHLRATGTNVLLLDAGGYAITIRGDTGDIDIGATATLDVGAAELVIPAVAADPAVLRQGHLWLRTDL